MLPRPTHCVRQPLKFGSDTKFHGSHYAGPQVDERDTFGTDAITRQMAGAALPDTNPSFGQAWHDGIPDRRRKPGLGRAEEDEFQEQPARPAKRFKGTRLNTMDDLDFYSQHTSPTDTVAEPLKSGRNMLTEDQKRQNHISSEQKRRDSIKNGFEELQVLVREIRSSTYSKSDTLKEAAAFAEELAEGNGQLEDMLGDETGPEP